jgi:hypothetical protein
MTKAIRRVLFSLALVASNGCSLINVIEENNRMVQASTAGIAANTETVQRSTRITEQLLPAMQGLQTLQTPMQAVGALRPTLESVAALGGPMTSVAALNSQMRAVAELQEPMAAVARLQGPMTGLTDLRPSLEATAALGGPMERLADMRPSLDAVAQLKGPMEGVAALEPELANLAGLQAAMQELAAMQEPLSRLAQVGAHPFLLLLGAVVGLGAWGGVTPHGPAPRPICGLNALVARAVLLTKARVRGSIPRILGQPGNDRARPRVDLQTSGSAGDGGRGISSHRDPRGPARPSRRAGG